jgi:response regulator RpfG family c-di-GMP phosphodiesterase
MLISTNITSIRLIKRTKDADKAKDKAYTKNIVQEIHITKENTKEVIKKIKHFNRKSVMFVIS